MQLNTETASVGRTKLCGSCDHVVREPLKAVKIKFSDGCKSHETRTPG